uniref:Uncharacterized protein n=1 Tax=Chromera velia CCMP2878 TaxID=1169474 RepID=A0A0G4GRP4_9ALVE|eukprot:Cvel_5102.t1-p1 / transcript=Cvel_5102.t1 / gene=Cvel_5102 / organism=Chromera_velia_CCMP2878 / gene_product=hypothetical protein / transcript_product=hypothetical protein / location=Cvel_scaffold233:52065-54111(+) / protein_length=484 / sequence_SO=supercontig / SO=protein_coding / is_pseudo=false
MCGDCKETVRYANKELFEDQLQHIAPSLRCCSLVSRHSRCGAHDEGNDPEKDVKLGRLYKPKGVWANLPSKTSRKLPSQSRSLSSLGGLAGALPSPPVPAGVRSASLRGVPSTAAAAAGGRHAGGEMFGGLGVVLRSPTVKAELRRGNEVEVGMKVKAKKRADDETEEGAREGGGERNGEGVGRVLFGSLSLSSTLTREEVIAQVCAAATSNGILPPNVLELVDNVACPPGHVGVQKRNTVTGETSFFYIPLQPSQKVLPPKASVPPQSLSKKPIGNSQMKVTATEVSTGRAREFPSLCQCEALKINPRTVSRALNFAVGLHSQTNETGGFAFTTTLSEDSQEGAGGVSEPAEQILEGVKCTSEAWVASWLGDGGQTWKKSFNIRNYGEEQVRFKALQCRVAKVPTDSAAVRALRQARKQVKHHDVLDTLDHTQRVLFGSPSLSSTLIREEILAQVSAAASRCPASPTRTSWRAGPSISRGWPD